MREMIENVSKALSTKNHPQYFVKFPTYRK
jgi:hypothetical protein